MLSLINALANIMNFLSIVFILPSFLSDTTSDMLPI